MNTARRAVLSSLFISYILRFSFPIREPKEPQKKDIPQSLHCYPQPGFLLPVPHPTTSNPQDSRTKLSYSS